MIFPDQEVPIVSLTSVSFKLDERRMRAMEDALPDEEKKELSGLRRQYEDAFRTKYEYCLVHGAAPEAMIDLLVRTRDMYVKAAAQYRDVHPIFFSPVSRKNFDVSPPPAPKGKLSCGHTVPIAVSSLRSFFPGNYKAYAQFLMKHNVLFNAPAVAASSGAMYVTPPRMGVQKLIGLHEYMDTSLLHWRDAPHVTPQTTRADLIKLLSHFDPDYPAFLFDQPGGTFLGEVDKEKAFSLSNESTLEDCVRDDFMTESNVDIHPLAAIAKMDAAGKRHMVYFDDFDGVRKPKVMSHLDASYYSKHDSFAAREGQNRGLGFVVYVGISDPVESLKTIDALYKKGQRRFCIEGANIYRSDTIFHLLAEAKNRYPDAFFLVGTTDSPEAVVMLSTYADAVKLLIGAGGVCDTNEVAMQSDELKVQRECGAAAQGVVSLVIDNLGDRKAFCIKAPTQECIAVQSGGGSILRRDSANPIAIQNGSGHPSKRVDGEAGEGAVEAMKAEQAKVKGSTPADSADRSLGHHNEGRTDEWKRVRRSPMLRKFYRKVLGALSSVGTYTGHSSLANMQGRQPDQGALLHYVYEVQRDKDARTAFEALRPEESDVFSTVDNYQRRQG